MKSSIKYLIIAGIGASAIFMLSDEKKPTFGNPQDYPTWDKGTSKIIATLHPSVRKKYQTWVNVAYSFGYKVLLYEGYRTFKRQNQLYALGRSKEGSKATNARGGESFHNFGFAADGGVQTSKGLIAYPSKVVELAKERGLSWGGDWVNFKDLPHIEYNKISTKILLELKKAGKVDKDGYVII